MSSMMKGRSINMIPSKASALQRFSAQRSASKFIRSALPHKLFKGFWLLFLSLLQQSELFKVNVDADLVGSV